MKPKIGIQSAGWYDHENPLKSLTYIKECGFEAIDFNIDSFLKLFRVPTDGIPPSMFDLSDEELLAGFAPLRDACEATGITISQIHAPFPVYFEGLDNENAFLHTVFERCLDIAAYLGSPAVVIHSAQCQTREQEWAVNLEIYRRLIPAAKRTGVKICTENLFHSFPNNVLEGRFSNATDAARLIDTLNAEAGEEVFGFCFDVGHAILTRRNIREYIKEMGNRLMLLHIHDNDGRSDLHMVPYTYLATTKAHVCDWEGFIEGLREIGFEGALSFETVNMFRFFPSEVHSELLRLVSSIGRYWAERISAEQ